MFDRYYCIKIENICYISRYFLHYFVSPFHRCLANVISTDYAPSRAGQYTSRNDSNCMAPVWVYWKLRSRALTAQRVNCLVNARLFADKCTAVNYVRHCFLCNNPFYSKYFFPTSNQRSDVQVWSEGINYLDDFASARSNHIQRQSPCFTNSSSCL